MVLALLIAAALAGYRYLRFDDDVRRVAEAAVNRYCEPFQARVGRAQLLPGKGVRLYDVEIVEPLATGRPRGVLQIDELRAEGDFDLSAVLNGAPTVSRVTVRSPRLAVTKRADGTWNAADLRLGSTSRRGTPPVIDVQNATVVITREGAPSDEAIAVHHLDAVVEPRGSRGERRYRFRVAARDTLARRVEIDGELAPDAGEFVTRFEVNEALFDPKLMRVAMVLGLAPPLPVDVAGLVSLKGEASQASEAGLTWSVDYRLTDGRLRVPVTRGFESVNVVGSATHAECRINEGSARWGDATLRLVGSRSGWGPTAPAAARLRLDDVALESLPRRLLPGPIGRLLDRFQPRGRANAAIDVAFDGRRWGTRATLDTRDASFTDAEKFPYRLTGAAGALHFNGGVAEQVTMPAEREATVRADLLGRVDGAPVRVVCDFRDVVAGRLPDGTRPKMPLGWVEVAGNGVRISPDLVAAVPNPAAREFIESLNADGRVDVRWRAERTDPNRPQPTEALDLRLVDCRVRYDRFPYPLSRVTGWVRQRGRDWTFTELRSLNEAGQTLVSGAGSLCPTAGGHRLDLRLEGAAAPLDETLYAALPRDAQAAWTALRPRGRLDFVADITRPAGAPDPAVRLTMTPTGRSVSIEPSLAPGGTPYRFERLGGDFVWEAGRLAILGARAEHGRTAFSSDGQWESLPDGGWRLDLERLSAERMTFNRDFLSSAPDGLRAVVEGLNPRGGFDVFDSRLEVTQRGDPTATVESRWRIGINCHQASLDCGVPIEGVSGVVRLGGRSDASAASTAGELDLDSAFWNDLHLTQVRGPFWADESNCFLGVGAAKQLRADPRPVTAKAYGGDLTADSWVRYDGRPRYGLRVGIDAVDVTRLASEWAGRREAISGSLDGTLEVEGLGTSVYGMQGRGQLAVSDADLYELPLLLSLLKYLRNGARDNTAFNRLETAFTIQGQDLQFEQLDLLGDAVSLYGRGAANLDRQVDLTFASIVGRNELQVPLLKSFVSSASEQLLRLEVQGSIDAPVIRRKMLPLVGNMLEQLQAEFGRSAGQGPRREANRRGGVGQRAATYR